MQDLTISGIPLAEGGLGGFSNVDCKVVVQAHGGFTGRDD